MRREMDLEADRLEDRDSWLLSVSFGIWQRICWMWNSSRGIRRWGLLALVPICIDRNAPQDLEFEIIKSKAEITRVRDDLTKAEDFSRGLRSDLDTAIAQQKEHKAAVRDAVSCRYVLLLLCVFDFGAV